MTKGKEIELQERCKELVENEVLTCISGLFEECIAKEIFNYNDLENLFEYRCPNCGEGYPDINNFGQETVNKNEFHCPNCDSHFDKEPENECQEIFEYWLVSKWLFERLEKNGEPVYNYNNFNYIWGRTTSGQMIYCDGIIEKIVKDLDKI